MISPLNASVELSGSPYSPHLLLHTLVNSLSSLSKHTPLKRKATNNENSAKLPNSAMPSLNSERKLVIANSKKRMAASTAAGPPSFSTSESNENQVSQVVNNSLSQKKLKKINESLKSNLND